VSSRSRENRAIFRIFHIVIDLHSFANTDKKQLTTKQIIIIMSVEYPSIVNVLLVGVGGFGENMAESLLQKNNVKLRILARNDDPKYKKFTDRGVELVIGNLQDKASLEKACHGIHTVVSAVNGFDEATMVDGQVNLLHAAEKAGCQRFVPSDLSLNYHALDYGDNVFLDFRKKVWEQVEKSSIGGISLLNGVFMDTLFSGFLGAFPNKDGVLTANRWGDGNPVLHATTREDSAKYLTEVILDPEIPKKAIVSVCSDAQTFNDIVKIAEQSGFKTEVKQMGSVDDMKAEIEKRKKADPRNVYSYIALQYMLPMVTGKGTLHNVISGKYKNVKPTTVGDYLKTLTKK